MLLVGACGWTGGGFVVIGIIIYYNCKNKINKRNFIIIEDIERGSK